MSNKVIDELEKENARLKTENERFKKKLNFMVDTADRLHGENTKLRECLEDYANEEFWQEVMLKHPVKDQWLPIGENGFHRAQECLKGLQ